MHLCNSVCGCTDLKVLVGQVDFQAERVDSLWERPCLQLSQREGVLTEPGQHVLHQDDLVTHLRLLQAGRRAPHEVLYNDSRCLDSSRTVCVWQNVCLQAQYFRFWVRCLYKCIILMCVFETQINLRGNPVGCSLISWRYDCLFMSWCFRARECCRPSLWSQPRPLCAPSWETCWWRWAAPDRRGSDTTSEASSRSSLQDEITAIILTSSSEHYWHDYNFYHNLWNSTAYHFCREGSLKQQNRENKRCSFVT